MTKSKLEWTGCIIFTLGVITAVSGFELSFTIATEASDIIALLALIVASYSARRAYLNHAQQLEPYLNFLYRLDVKTGTVSLYIQNVGGGFAKINKAYLRLVDTDGKYYDYFPLVKDREGQSISQLIKAKPKADMLLAKLFTYAHHATPNSDYLLSNDLIVTIDSYEFTGNEAIGRDEKTLILKFQHDILKHDAGFEDFTSSLMAHLHMLNLFVEYQDVTKDKYFLPSEEIYKASESESFKEVDIDSITKTKWKVSINIGIPDDLANKL